MGPRVDMDDMKNVTRGHCIGNGEINVWFPIPPPSPAYAVHLIWKSIFLPCIHKLEAADITESNIAVGKTAFKWKAADM
jgi:hypothetical protein